MNDAIAMMFSILIVMFGYLVFKIRTDQSQTTTTSTRKRNKKKGTGKPVIKNNWNMRPLDTKDPADNRSTALLGFNNYSLEHLMPKK